MKALRPLIAALALASLPAFAQDSTHWVATWTAAPMPLPGEKAETADITLRNHVHLSLGGSQFRIKLSNEFGTDPLIIGGASMGLAGTAPGSATNLTAITFSGQPGITLAPGATVESDPVNLAAPALSNLAVSLLLPAQKIDRFSGHAGSVDTNYTATGNQLMAPVLANTKELIPWRILTNIDVMAPAADASIVCIGDSITDGATSTRSANMRWPNILAARLQADPAHANFAAVDQGIGGNRILNDGTGPALIKRWDRDALSPAGVKYIIVLESINDIGHSSLVKEPNSKFAGEPIITADQLIAAMTDLINQAHAQGIKVIGATITPFKGAGYARPDGIKIRDQVNDFIRNGGKFDGVIDFARATADPKDPEVLNPAFNLKDKLHPDDDGYKAMADSIDLNLFK